MRPPRYAAGFAGCPALLGWPGGKHKLGALPLKQCSPTAPGRPPLLGAARGGRKSTPNGIDTDGGGYRCGFHLALCVVEQRKAQREKGRGLSEGRRPEFRSPPLRLSSAEHPARAGRRGGRAFFLGTSSWQDKKKCLACRRSPAYQCRRVVRKLTRRCAPASAKRRGTAPRRPG